MIFTKTDMGDCIMDAYPQATVNSIGYFIISVTTLFHFLGSCFYLTKLLQSNI